MLTDSLINTPTILWHDFKSLLQ